MKQSYHLLIVSVLFPALLPVTVWGYGFFDYQNDRSYLPYARPVGGNHHPGSLRLQTGITVDGYYVRAYLEGLRPEDIQVYPRRNRLVLQFAKGNHYRLNSPAARRATRWQMGYRRQLRLPYDADWTRMTTSKKNGVMEIYIPRISRYKPTDP